MENSTNFNGVYAPSLEEKTDNYIRQIDKNHADYLETPLGKHAKPVQTTETTIRKTYSSYDQQTDQADIRWAANTRLQMRLQSNELIRKETRNLSIKQVVGKIITTGLIAITAGTCVGHVAAYYNQNTLDMDDTVIEQNDNVIVPTPIENGDEIIPTKEEYEAGLTQEQLAEKRALDAEENAKLYGFIEAGRQQVQEYNEMQEEIINSRSGHTR